MFVAPVLVQVLDGSTARGDDLDPAALFDKGLADMRAHRFPEACRELAESYRIDPHAGGLFTLAECETQSGKTASALADYDRFLNLVAHLPARDRTKQAERAKVAAERRAALARDVPTLTISLDASVPAGSTVTVDGRAIPSANVGSLLPEDPGDHVVSVRAPDGRTGEAHASLAPRDARATRAHCRRLRLLYRAARRRLPRRRTEARAKRAPPPPTRARRTARERWAGRAPARSSVAARRSARRRSSGSRVLPARLSSPSSRRSRTADSSACEVSSDAPRRTLSRSGLAAGGARGLSGHRRARR